MIRFEKVFLRFDTGISLRELNFTIDQGEFLYLYGDSGSGKSSILKMIYMDLFPNSGTVSVLDFDSSQIKRRDIAIVRQKIGMVFQDFYLLSDRDIYSNIAYSRIFIFYLTGIYTPILPSHSRSKVSKQTWFAVRSL